MNIQVVEKECGSKYYACKEHAAILVSFPTMKSPCKLQVLIFLGTSLEVLMVVRIHNVIWASASYSLVLGYQCSGRTFCPSFPGHLKMMYIPPKP
jgi:hypothetical protein